MDWNKYWKDKFNSLPRDIRHIACATHAYTNLQYLEREKIRLKKRYNQSLREINEHKKNIEDWVKSNFHKEYEEG